MAEYPDTNNSTGMPKPPTESALPNIRTYKGDVADSMRDGKTSMASIVLQEQTKNYLTEEEKTTKELRLSKTLVIGILIFFALGALTISYFLFVYKGSAPEINLPINTLPAPLISAESRTTYSLAGKDQLSAYKNLATLVGGASSRANTLQEVIPVAKDVNGSEYVLSLQEFLPALGITSTDRFARFLNKRFMLGMYTFRETSAFLLLEPLSYGPVFAELLEWEQELPALFYPLLSGKSLPTDQATWRDEIIKNIDTRVLRDSAGKLFMIYAFLPSKDKLVITTNLDTWNEVVTRSQTPNPVIQ